MAGLHLLRIVKDGFFRGLLWSLAIVAAFYLAQLLLLMARFVEFPNYVRVYDWPGNVARIIRSTPSLKDTLLIAKDEWLLEVGFMNYDFGSGISEWSLYLAPAEMLAMLAVGGLLVTNLRLFRDNRRCALPTGRGAAVGGGIGASLAALSSVTMSWVVCCSTPTWVVGLAILGLSVGTCQALEPLGVWLNLSGFALLAGVAVFQAHQAVAALPAGGTAAARPT
jgi:hypothetical protein